MNRFCVCDNLYENLQDANGCECYNFINVDGQTCVIECPENSTANDDAHCECNDGYDTNDEFECIIYQYLCVEPFIWFNNICHECTSDERLDVTKSEPICVSNCIGVGVEDGAIDSIDRFCVCDELHDIFQGTDGCLCLYLVGLDGFECVRECPINSHEIIGECNCDDGYGLTSQYECIKYQEMCEYPNIWYVDTCHDCSLGQVLDTTLVDPLCVDICEGPGVQLGAIDFVNRYCMCDEMHQNV